VTFLVSVMSFPFTLIYPTILTLQSSYPSRILILTTSPAYLPVGTFQRNQPGSCGIKHLAGRECRKTWVYVLTELFIVRELEQEKRDKNSEARYRRRVERSERGTSIYYTEGVQILEHLRGSQLQYRTRGGSESRSRWSSQCRGRQTGWLSLMRGGEGGQGKLWQAPKKAGCWVNKNENISGEEVQA